MHRVPWKMRLHPALAGQRVRKKDWPMGQFYLVMVVGKFNVVFKDEFGKEVIQQRDDTDKNWDVVRQEKFN